VSLTTNTRLGRYEVLAFLGAGGMSEVYRARDTRLDRDVAIKVLPASAFADSRRLDRLLREARAISRLNHPHIRALYDVGQQDGVTFLVMELLEGKTLADALLKGPPPVGHAIAFGLQIAQALDAAHTSGVIHRDLKPSNIMLTKDGVKLLDFSLAKVHECEERPDTLDATRGVGPTEEGAVLGTCPYMSPEQLQGREVDARSDIFSLGVVLYEMTSGSRPFHADNRAALTAAILTETPAPVSTICAAPPLLDRAIGGCLDKDPESRWQSARDLASALRWAMEGEGSHAGPPGRFTTKRASWWDWKAPVAACIVALLAGAGHLASGLRNVQPAPPAARITLVVLPFENLSGDEEQEYLSDGMTEEMIAQLGTFQPARLGVIARTSAMHYKDTTKRVDEIASELGAHYLLEGSIRRTGDKVRIAAQLIDARNQSQVWTEQYDRDMRDVLRLQQEVARAIARNMAGNLGVISAGMSSSPVSRHSRNPEAYEHYLRGRYHLLKDSVDGLWKAYGHFRKAIAVDPSYALAYSGLADTYALLGSYDIMPITESHPLGRDAALKALQLDDALSEAHVSLAAIIADHYWDWAEAERHYKRAIELAPNDVNALRYYSFYLGYTGRAHEGLPIAERAASLDPVSPNVQMNAGVMLNFAGRFDDAVTRLEQTLELDPNFSLAYAMLGFSYLGKGMPERAVSELTKARVLAGPRPNVIALHAHALARAGRRDEALRALADLHGLARPRGPSPFLVAMVYVGLGDNDRAFEWLDKAVEARDWQLPLLKAEPAFAALRSDPRFPTLLARLNLPRQSPH
jgi:TolB-like protein/Tfp pilus assembly protein PilF/tRNA A-37 threonylcarbamoyl transferase component Bud32